MRRVVPAAPVGLGAGELRPGRRRRPPRRQRFRPPLPPSRRPPAPAQPSSGGNFFNDGSARKTTASPRRQSESGRTVGRHRVVRVVAEGDGRDTVLEARTANGARVALTLIGEPLAADTERLRTVVRLLRVRAALQHPALVPLRGPFQHDRRVYYTTPFPDRTLAARLSGGVLAPEEAVRLLAPVAAALEVAAAKGVFHRGLTPQAIVLDGSRQVPARLTDFAITRAAAPACAAPDGLDGVEYRCPEELRGEASRCAARSTRSAASSPSA